MARVIGGPPDPMGFTPVSPSTVDSLGSPRFRHKQRNRLRHRSLSRTILPASGPAKSRLRLACEKFLIRSKRRTV